MTIRAVATILAAAGVAVATSEARAELAPWDQAKVTALSKQLADAAAALNETFYRQPVPTAGSVQTRGYQRMKEAVNKIQREAKSLNAKLSNQGDRASTLKSYQDLMQTVNVAREEAKGLFTTTDVAEKAGAARSVLNQLGPYYDPDFKQLEKVTR
jgi:hypothetical protein